ncbi:hypothetical protein AusDCA_2106 [Desulfitobacterium sp. AusDCA]
MKKVIERSLLMPIYLLIKKFFLKKMIRQKGRDL